MTCPLQNIKNELPARSPVRPVQLELDSEIQFHCHKNIKCFNRCCQNIDITLLPYDIARLKRRAGLSSSQWVNRHTVPFAMDGHGMPGLKLATKPGTAECVFLTPQGCGVYADRPSACRYYALGTMSVRTAPDKTAAVKKSAANANPPPAVKEIYFVVKESHCFGHAEPRKLTVRQYRREQGLEEYDAMNRGWREIILKKRSSGPTVGKPSARSLQLFDMCSYDLDNFRAFVNRPAFAEVFALSAAELAELNADEDRLLQFAYRFLKQVLFGEQTIAVRPDAKARRMRRRVTPG